MIALGETKIGKIYLGETEIKKVYLGEVLMFEQSSSDIIMTSTSNPQVLAVCHAQGWCSNPNYMTKSEAEAVTSIGTVFRDNTAITHFDEFEYFTGVTSLASYAFACKNLTTVKIPDSNFYYCTWKQLSLSC